MGQVVSLELVERGFYVRVPFLLLQAVAVEVDRHHELAKVRSLLDLEDKGVWPEGVKDAAWHVDGVAGPDFVLRHDGFVVLGPERTDELLSREVILDACEYLRVVDRPQDVPRLRLAVGFA